MPYIKDNRREYLWQEKLPETGGDLNYIITRLCKEFLDNLGENYERINQVIGALECAKQEFYRRIVSPYEDKKIKENGDVF
jgi:hypothetical protein